MRKYSIAVGLLLIGIISVHAKHQHYRKDETQITWGDVDSFGFDEQVEDAPKSRVRRLTPCNRPMPVMISKEQSQAVNRQVQQQLREQRVRDRARAADEREAIHGPEWERQRVQRENIEQRVNWLRNRANIQQERRDQERGAEELRQLRNNEMPYHRPP